MSPVNPDVLNALTAGIQSEVASYVFYLEASKKNEVAQFKEVLEKLAFEEKDHFHILERQYDSLVRSEKWISTVDILKQEGLPEITEEMSRQHQNLIDRVIKADSLKSILDIAYQLEEEAHLLFKNAVEIVNTEEGKKMFKQLSKFEEGHMKMIDGMKKAYL